MTPFFSIIVPVYNSESTIVRTIESVLNQKFNDYELIIVNDGSNDNSQTVIEGYLNKTDKIQLINISNSGVSVARNIGIDHSKGKYILFLDSDDYLEDYCLLKVKDILKENTQMVFFGYSVINAQGKTMRIAIPPDNLIHLGRDKNFTEFVILLHKYKLLNSASNKAFLKSFLNENNIRFENNLELGEDLIFNLNILKTVETILFVQDKLITFESDFKGLVSKYRNNRSEINRKIEESFTSFFNFSGENEYSRKFMNNIKYKNIITNIMEYHKSDCYLTFDEKISRMENYLSKEKENFSSESIKDLTLTLTILIMILRIENYSLIFYLTKVLFKLRRIY